MDPLFLDTMEDLRGALRLTDLRDDSDAIKILEQAVRQARFRFYQRLGSSTVAAILAVDLVADPTTTAEMKRFVGTMCETEMVRLDLMDRMPLIFMDASGATRETYNNEGAFRSMDPQILDAARNRIGTQVENWLAFMAGEIDLGDGEDARVFTQAKPDPTPILGSSTWIGGDPNIQGPPFTNDPGTFDGNFISGLDEITGLENGA